MDINTFSYFLSILQTFIIYFYIYIFEDESLQDERKYNNVWMSIRLLLNEYLKINGKWDNESLRIWSPGVMQLTR